MGFSLVEVMVAMVIGMLGIIVMMQVFGVSEGQKRTTTGSDDASSSGAIALYNLQRDIQHSGWGLSALPLVGCWTTTPGGIPLRLSPVTINPTMPDNVTPLISGQDPNTETLLVVSGSSSGTVLGDAITGGAGPSTAPLVKTPTSFSLLDWVIAVPLQRTEPCAASALARVQTQPAALTALSLSTAVAGELLFNLGGAPTARGYAIRSGNLTTCDFFVTNCSVVANWTNIASNVVSLRAQYGQDAGPTPMTGIANAWSHSTTPTTGCGWVRTPVLRIALVMRNTQPERPNSGGIPITPVVPVWAGSDPVAQAAGATEAAAVAFTLPSPDVTWPRWQDFRYQVFQTIVPLRNITSTGAVEGC
jgi:type IV pilus assembly protein PilW